MSATIHLDAEGTALARFFAKLARAPSRTLILDYDGTLAPFHADPLLARPYAGVRESIRAIHDETRTRIVLVSGRALADLEAVAFDLPRHEAWGTHGWERRTGNGDIVRIPVPARALRGLDAAHAALPRSVLDAARVERKSAGVAVHWRGLPEDLASQVGRSVAEAWSGIAAEDLALLPFDGGLELRARGRHKGEVVASLLDEDPVGAFAYLGDDLTDEDAFAAIAARGLAVLVRPTARPTLAACHIRPPEELLAFLERWRRITRQTG